MTTPDRPPLPDEETAQRYERLLAALKTVSPAEEPHRLVAGTPWNEAEDGDDL